VVEVMDQTPPSWLKVELRRAIRTQELVDQWNRGLGYNSPAPKMAPTLAHRLRQLIDGIAPQCAPDGWVPPLSIPVFELEALLVPFEPPRAVPYPEPPTDPMDDLDCEACQ